MQACAQCIRLGGVEMLTLTGPGRHELAMAEFRKAKQNDPEFCDVDQNIGQHYIRECQEAV